MEAAGDPDKSNFPGVVEAKARLEDVGEKGKERIGNSKYRQLWRNSAATWSKEMKEDARKWGQEIVNDSCLSLIATALSAHSLPSCYFLLGTVFCQARQPINVFLA